MRTALLWFRRDLRLADNPALQHALDHFERVIPLYIHSPDVDSPWQPGAASNWWLHHSLAALDEALQQRGSRLLLRQGRPLEVLSQLREESKACTILWNRRYEPHHITEDKAIKAALLEAGCSVTSFNASLLFEPWQVVKEDGSPYRVFTPFWKACQRRGLPQTEQSVPSRLPPVPASLKGITLAELGLLPTSGWDSGLRENWRPGEAAALQRLDHFLDDALLEYQAGRDIPAEPATSCLSPALHFGEVGPRQLVSAIAQRTACDSRAGVTANGEAWLRQLLWREFAHAVLYHFPHSSDAPFDVRFADFAWQGDYAEALGRWQRGQTGIPIVDAGMRQLWHSGWMHNRVRMIAASLLTKNLLIPWQEGARWFWDTLVDADLANNSFGWQWVAGCGTDAAPYFRIFNPVLQGGKFDPAGRYVRHWLPELAALPNRYLHSPWLAPERILREAGITLDVNYPAPIVDLKGSRERALERYKRLRSKG